MAALAATALAPPALAQGQSSQQQTFSAPTYSSPIALSRDRRFVWVVNPGADTVSVIRTATNAVIRTIRVGDEPQSVALDPINRYAFVANAAAGTVTVIRVTNPNERSFRAQVSRTFTTGSEPWNIVATPDGQRVLVANSGQDTITVLDAVRPRILGHVDLRRSLCNDPDRERHFQPRGLAVTRGSTRLYVTGFLAFTRPGGRQGDDDGKQGVVCRLSIDTDSDEIGDYRVARRITLAARVTGFTVDRSPDGASPGDGALDPTSAFPNQLQSVVIRGNDAYLPNIAASPDGPLRFNVDTQAFVNVVSLRGTERDASASKFLNLHLGARDPEPGRKRLFFANPWAIGFTTQSGAGAAYVVSAASDLLVKVNVAANGRLSFTGDADTTRYIDLDDPANPATVGEDAGKNPQGIVVDQSRRRAYVANFVSRNVTVVDLRNDRVLGAIRTAPIAAPGSPGEIVEVGADMFFSSRGSFNRPAGTAVSTDERLSSEGWQACSSCHFKGLTDGVIWEFASGPRKSVPLNPTFNPRNRNEQRVLNYSAVFDEVEDFEINSRNISGPGPLAEAIACSAPPPDTATNDPNHGLLIGDNGDINTPPCVVNAFARANAERPQHTVTLPGSGVAVPALTALREWVRVAVRTHDGPLARASLTGSDTAAQVASGRRLFQSAGCADCHGGGKWTISTKDFVSPPDAAIEVAVENVAPLPPGVNPVGVQYLFRFLREIRSFNLGVPGAGNELGANVGAAEKATSALNAAGVAQPQQDALGTDFNGDGRGRGYNVPSVLGINAVPPYYHNGACETLRCVVDNPLHRTVAGTRADGLPNARQRADVVTFLRSIDAGTPPFP